MARGEVIGAYGLTEPGAGSDSGGTRTTARLEDGPDGGSWVLDGGKRFITNAGQAGTYVVTARTGTRDDGNAEISAFIVPADTPGFSVGRLRTSSGCTPRTGEPCSTAHASRPRTCSASGVAASPRSSRSSMAVGSRSARSRSDRAARRRVDPVCPDARAVRRPIGTFQGGPSWSPTWRPRSRPRAARSGGRLAQGPGSRTSGWSPAQAKFCVRGQLARHQQRDPDPRL